MNRFGPTISSLMYVVFLYAVFLAIGRYAAGPWSLAWILPFALLVVMVASCVKLRQSQWMAIDTENVRIDPEGAGIPREVSEYYRHAVAGLTPLGFKPVLSYRKTKLVPNAIGFSTVFKNDRTSEVATIVNSFASIGIMRIKTSLLVFRTEFADGTEVATSNNNTPSHFPPPRPPVHVFVFPQVRDPARLYEVHQAVVGQFDEGSLRRDPIGDDPDAYLKQSQQREHARFLACGYHYLDEAKGVQRLTWKGAFMATLKLNWPVKRVRKVWRRWKASRMLNALNLAVKG
jgi:hypothetical protein